MPSHDFRARVGLTRSQGVANRLFTLCAPEVSKKFHFSGLQFLQLTLVKKKYRTLELVPSSISPFLIFLWPLIRRYRTEYLALYAVLATKYLFHTQLAIKWLTQMTKTLKTLFFFIFYHPSPRQPAGKVQSFGPGPGGWGYSEGGQIKTNFSLFFCVCLCVRIICGRVKQ